MEQWLKNELWDLARMLGTLALMFSPMIIFVWWTGKRKEKYKQEATAPFTGQPLHPPGESLRLKIQELDDKLTEELLLMIMVPSVVAAVAAVGPASQSLPTLIGFFTVVALFVLWRGWRVFAKVRTLWDYRLGFDGERVVGEALNQLMLDGYRVFHDVPFEGFNIDHVVVGKSGIYSIETKTRRKPTNERGKKTEWTVYYDGKALHWPWGVDTYGLEQATRNARSLSVWLGRVTKAQVNAHPVLVLPGWFVPDIEGTAVTVRNENRIGIVLKNQAPETLSADQIQHFAGHLAEKCRLPLAS